MSTLLSAPRVVATASRGGHRPAAHHLSAVAREGRASRPSDPTLRRGRRALLLENVHPYAVTVLEEAGWEVDHRAEAMTEDELVTAVTDADVLGVRSRTRVTARVMHAGHRLAAVGAFCIGTDQIDLAAAAGHQIAVFNAPYSNTRSVVELAVADIIALSRRLTERNGEMHTGRWQKTAAGSREVRGQRLGIVGYGSIGSQLSVVAEALGMQVSFYDTADRLALGNARRCSNLEELLAQSDVVSLHVDGRPSNDRLITARELALMPPGSVLLNLSRGRVLDVPDLARALSSGHLAGAALDVFPDEPGSNGDSFGSPLRGLPNVILTPHIGGSTEQAQRDIAACVATKLLAIVGTEQRAAA